MRNGNWMVWINVYHPKVNGQFLGCYLFNLPVYRQINQKTSVILVLRIVPRLEVHELWTLIINGILNFSHNTHPAVLTRDFPVILTSAS